MFEADLPDLLEVKERVLADIGAQPQCNRVVVPVDLRDDWLSALSGCGLRSRAADCMVGRGPARLPRDRRRARTAATVGTASAPGSRLAFERSAKARDVTADDTAAVTSLWRGGVGDDVEKWLAAQGWTVTVDNLGDVAAAYGRAPSRPTTSGFVRATR